jgi:GST-like protein
MAIFPWGRIPSGYYEASELIGMDAPPNVQGALPRFVTRPAVARGLTIPSA